eukprot:TRINITY_DN236_c0_g1_i1.p1 TRINITY_DN236_c0_g1~~TRINITY_DN236_c0_g1_i1.p1  ORF type:complete len:488 (-),score=41.69 TRINITY_DN236_c0_g1_i1:432-1895(-)
MKKSASTRLQFATELLLPAVVALSLIITTSGQAIPFYCRLNEVRCPSGIKSCVFALGICNGVKDCPDGSDENPAMCKKYNCSNIDYELQFTRGNLDVAYFTTSKCPSGNMCTKRPTYEFNPDEESYPLYWKCTGGPKECADGSDEDPKYCKNLDCTKIPAGTPREFSWDAATCPSKKYCLYPACNTCGDNGEQLLCNGVKDCPDGSDEWPSFCKTNGCGNTFQCSDGSCVRNQKVCDGVPDCSDGKDEDPAFCASFQCTWSGSTRCPGTNTCLRQTQICDGTRNCPDGSDEDPARCRAYTCAEGGWKCKDGLQCAYTVFPKYYAGIFRVDDPRCNGVFECKDKSDENPAVCPGIPCRTKCPGSKICINSRSYRSNGLCDGITTCADGSDESKTLCKKLKCDQFHEVKCKVDQTCIRGGYCDGRVDCADKTDEDPATCKKYKCGVGMSKCLNFPYQCVRDELLCDGIKHCINGGDEDPAFCSTFTPPP